MLKFIRLGPGSLGTGRYFGEGGGLAPLAAALRDQRAPASTER